MTSPTGRTNALLRERGYLVRVVESYNHHTKRRKDLFGFIDIVGIHPDILGVLGVQTTTGTNLAARITKAEALPAYWQWLACGNDVEFHGWRKILKVKGGKVKIWAPKIHAVSFRELFG